MVGPLELIIQRVCKNGCKKICKIFASELGSKTGVMRGFQKGITLSGRTSGSDYIECFQKTLQNICIRVGIQVGGHERFPKRYKTWWWDL